MQVIFIHHSCFLVEVDDLVLIFDYFGGDREMCIRDRYYACADHANV